MGKVVRDSFGNLVGIKEDGRIRRPTESELDKIVADRNPSTLSFWLKSK